MLHRLSISNRLLFGFSALIILLVVLSGVSTVLSYQTENAVAESKRTASMVIGLKDALLSVRQGRVRTWTYAVTGNSADIAGRDEAFALFKTQYADLQTNLNLTPGPGHVMLKEFYDGVIDFEDKAKALNDLTAKGVSYTSPEFTAAVAAIDGAAKRYADTNAKAANHYAESRDKAVAEADKQVQLSRTASLIAGAVGLVAGLTLSLLIGRSITRPIKAITSAMRAMAGGNLEVSIPATDSTDEVGSMAKALTVFRDGLRRANQLAAEQDSERVKREARAHTIETMTKDFDSTVSRILEAVGGALNQLEATSSTMSANSEQTRRQAAVVAASTERASSSVQTVATAAEELSSSIQEIARQVEQSSRTSQAASDEANRTNQTVRGLAESSARIGDVVNLINDIASQTNLLALNATIEAARAGDAGKGFAVVAGEVKNLANQTARATDEISAQIGAVQSSTQDAVAAIATIVARITEINEIAGAISAAVEQQSAATGEIARNIQQAAVGTEEVSVTIGGVTQAAEETGRAAGQVLSSTQSLTGETNGLKETISRFLQGVRTA